MHTQLVRPMAHLAGVTLVLATLTGCGGDPRSDWSPIARRTFDRLVDEGASEAGAECAVQDGVDAGLDEYFEMDSTDVDDDTQERIDEIISRCIDD